MISLNILKCDHQLPSVRSLAQELGVNPNTVQKVYQMLERDEIVYSVAGKGCFIRGNHSAIQQRRNLAIKHLRENLNLARDLGLREEEAIQIVRDLYRREIK